MLVSSSNDRGDLPAALDSIHNYYQPLVVEQLHLMLTTAELTDQEYLADIACVALNHLPPRYVRHDVDMAFYLSSSEREEMAEKVRQSVRMAIDFVNSRRRDVND